jgi:hypothetical protein
MLRTDEEARKTRCWLTASRGTPTNCVASACMAWRYAWWESQWLDPPSAPAGYCGAAGEPQLPTAKVAARSLPKPLVPVDTI